MSVTISCKSCNKQDYIDEYMAGRFRRGGSLDPEGYDSDPSVIDDDAGQDEDDVTQEEFSDFVDWLDRNQPDETPKAKRRPPADESPACPHPKAAVYVEPTACPKCFKSVPQCSFSGVLAIRFQVFCCLCLIRERVHE